MKRKSTDISYFKKKIRTGGEKETTGEQQRLSEEEEENEEEDGGEEQTEQHDKDTQPASVTEHSDEEEHQTDCERIQFDSEEDIRTENKEKWMGVMVQSQGIVRMEQKNNTLLEMGFYDDGPFEVGDENLLYPDLVPVPANSYMGGCLSPRRDRKENEASTRLSPEFTLQGPSLASSFGYDVAVVDLNGDGWQGIVVGAPQFFLKDGDVGRAAYVYINQAGKWNRVTPVRLNGTKDSIRGIIHCRTKSVVFLLHRHRTKRHKRQHKLPGLVPILDTFQLSKMASEVNFLKEGCGSDNVCQSNLRLHIKFCSKESNQDVEKGLPVFSVSEQKKDLALQVTVRNRDRDDAHEAGSWGPSPTASPTRASGRIKLR
ncbi:hypothetical protein CRUP_000002 [Coryphaenoides rupestris]|nr:hypothetical protein CRUP_000002 [Coryphaenoides rupestris]